MFSIYPFVFILLFAIGSAFIGVYNSVVKEKWLGLAIYSLPVICSLMLLLGAFNDVIDSSVDKHQLSLTLYKSNDAKESFLSQAIDKERELIVMQRELDNFRAAAQSSTTVKINGQEIEIPAADADEPNVFEEAVNSVKDAAISVSKDKKDIEGLDNFMGDL
jgi:hypothetical protein